MQSLSGFTGGDVVTEINYWRNGQANSVSLVYEWITNDRDSFAYMALNRDEKEIHIRGDDVQTRIADGSASGMYKLDKMALDKFRQTNKNWDPSKGDAYWCPVEVRDVQAAVVTLNTVKAWGRRPAPWLVSVIKALDAGEDAYANFWEKTLLAAVDFSKLQHKETGGFNVFNRFLNVPASQNLGIVLFLVVTKWNPNKRANLENAMTAAIAEVGQKYPGQVTFRILSDQQFQNEPGLIELPSHPLGFYKTYAKAPVIDALARLRVGGGSWIRDFPQTVLVVDNLKTQLMQDTGNRFWKKMSQVTDHTTTETKLPHGAAIDNAKREQTERIMGASANQWSLNTLGWAPQQNPKTPSAEWLHRMAHRFGGSGADYFTNLVFGTHECNTHMIRSEATLSQLLACPSIRLAIMTTTSVDTPDVAMLERDGVSRRINIPWHNANRVVDRYYYWMATALDYKIEVYTYATNDQFWDFTTTHYPWWRYVPLRAEVDLDKLVTKYFLTCIATGW